MATSLIIYKKQRLRKFYPTKPFYMTANLRWVRGSSPAVRCSNPTACFAHTLHQFRF